MTSEISYNTRVYTDIQSLQQLHGNSDKEAVKKEVAQQFESIMMQMVLHSMRDATKAMSSDLFSNNQMELYQDLFDKQLALVMSNSSTGFAKIIERSIDKMSEKQLQAPVQNTPAPIVKNDAYIVPVIPNPTQHHEAQENITESAAASHTFSSQEDFVKKLWSTARTAANMIGAAPEVLLAQAALETNWGKSILQENHSSASSNNLFNIKADKNWAQKTTTVDALEHRNGLLVKEKSTFKSYNSYLDSFLDYVDLLKKNSRYSEALNKAHDPEQFVQALQKAGYATDQNYAEKIHNLFSSRSFQDIVNKVKNI